MKKMLNYFSTGELMLWCFSVALIVVSFCIFGGTGLLTLVASLIGVINFPKRNCYNVFHHSRDYNSILFHIAVFSHGKH